MRRLTSRLDTTVLGFRDFRLLWAGQAISAIGDMIFPVAVAVFVLDAGGGAGDVGLVLAARFLALVLFALFGGVWADRLRRTRVMIGADLLRAVAVLGLALVPGTPSVAVLAVLTFLVGGGEAFFRPAYGALLPTILPPDRLAVANSLGSMSVNVARVVGPGLGGVLVAAAGPRPAFVVDAATFMASLLTLVRIHEPAHDPAERRTMLREIGEGLGAVRDRPWITAILALAAAHLMLAVAPIMVLLPIVSRERLGGDSAYGLVLAIGALGSLLGAGIAGRWRPRNRGTVGVLGLVPFGLEPLALWAPLPLVAVAAVFFVAGIGFGPFVVYWESALQADVPRELLARVVSLDWMCSLALLPLGLALVGPAVHALGRGPVLALATAMCVVPTALVLLVPGVPQFRTPPRVREPDVGGGEVAVQA